MRVAVRGFAGKQQVFEELLDTDVVDLDELAKQQIERMVAYPAHMIEIEFLDEPDQNQRYFRFGSDPSGMVMPIAIAL